MQENGKTIVSVELYADSGIVFINGHALMERDTDLRVANKVAKELGLSVFTVTDRRNGRPITRIEQVY